jgi:hypothetical protein
LVTLLAEQSELKRQIASHREERSRLMREAEAPSLGAITAIAAQTDQARLRMEWLAGQLPGLQAEILEEQRVAREAVWTQTHVPNLAAAENRLTAAIEEFFAALSNAHQAHAEAFNFGQRVTDIFVRPPPHDYPTSWSLREYLKTVQRRQQHVPVTMEVQPLGDAFIDITPLERWKPLHGGRVPPALIEAISPIAPRRQVRFLHRVNIGKVMAGYTSVEAGTVMWLTSRAAYACTYVGAAEYCDAEVSEPAA